MSKIFLIDKNIITYSDLKFFLGGGELDMDLSKIELGILSFIKMINTNDKDIEYETSGTTGEPKKVYHNYNSLTKNIKIDKNLIESIWGLTYDYKKIAGSQVILQSFLNNSTIVNLYGKSKKEIHDLIEYQKITHISGTPTFYKLLIDGGFVYNNIKQLTLGGEVSENYLLNKLTINFPNAKVTNIYASTEFGTLLTTNGQYFKITEKNHNLVKIVDDEIVVHSSLLSQDTNLEWFNTGDKIEWVDDDNFKIVGRQTNMINVGGVKVNPIKVENLINSLEYVLISFVYGIKNSLMGNVVSVDLVLKFDKSIKDIKFDLRNLLEPYEVPLKINIVEKININSTGKIDRK